MIKVLVIEDDRTILNEVAEWLRFEGFHPITATNGREGVEKALQFLPDLILSDISMPELSGYEVLNVLQKEPKLAAIPFIFLTAHADKASIRVGMSLGADDYLIKPFTHDELFETIQTRLRRHNAIKLETHQELEELKRKLIRVVGHELKTPLVALSVFQEIIERQIQQLSRDEISDLLQTLRSGTDRLQHLVQQVVTLAQIEAKVLSSDVVRDTGKAVSLWHVIPDAIKEARRCAYRNREGHIIIEQRDTELLVWGLAALIRQTVMELLTNALNFSPDNAHIKLTHSKFDGQLWITIEDVGRGISNTDILKVKQPFVQIGREKHEQQGVGLGLALAKRIVELHRGDFLLHSEVNKGTQVSIGFPIYHP